MAALTMASCATGREQSNGQVPIRVKITPSQAAARPEGASPAALGEPGDEAANGDRPVWTERLADHQDFLRFSTPVRGIPFTKFVIDRKTGRIFYFWTAVYPFHYNFINEVMAKEIPGVLDHMGPGGNWGEGLVLGSLGYHRGVYGFEFLEADTPTPEVLRFTYRRIEETFPKADVRFRAVSKRQQELAKAVGDVPWIGADFLSTQDTYQCLNEGKAIGRLKVLAPGEDPVRMAFPPGTIVVLDEVPNDISHVDGILATRFSTPLSHVNLRATAWGVPNAGNKTIAPLAKELDGKIVYYEAGPTSMVLREATPEERAEFERGMARSGGGAKKLLIPPADLEFRGLPRLVGLTERDVVRVGAKAANLGVLATRGSGDSFEVPPGLAIPFSYYVDHVRQGIQPKIDALLSDEATRSDVEALDRALAGIREAIGAAPLEPGFREELLVRVHHLFGEAGLFVRSSTNAEDLPGFNGAGLYDTVPNVRGDEALVAAVKQVWASVWNLRAFREREFRGIDHRSVYPGVIIQVGVDADAAGVLITKDILRKHATSGIFINAKRGLGIRVVDGKRVPEQVLYDENLDEIRVISRSQDDVALKFAPGGGVKEVKVGGGGVVLTEARVRALVRAAQEARKLFPWVKQALDIEWLMVGDRVYLVQARPYVEAGR